MKVAKFKSAGAKRIDELPSWFSMVVLSMVVI